MVKFRIHDRFFELKIYIVLMTLRMGVKWLARKRQSLDAEIKAQEDWISFGTGFWGRIEDNVSSRNRWKNE